MSDVVEKIRVFVEEECKKPTSKYGYDPYQGHFTQVHKYAKLLAEKHGANIEIAELAAWLHDIGSIIYGREDHHTTGAKIAEEELAKLNYPKEKINIIKNCILLHRGSKYIKRETIESEILADADGMAHFDNISGIFMAAFVYENKNRMEAEKSVFTKLTNAWNKLSPVAQEIMAPKYNAARLLLNEN